MPPTPQQQAIPVEDSYLELLKEAIEAAGGQSKVARDVGVNQSTISKSLSRRVKLTYTTMAKLSRHLGLPEPVIPIRDVAHAQWCEVGARLQISKPSLFSCLLSAALEGMDATDKRPSDDSLDALHAIVADPIPRTRKQSRKS